MPINPNIALQVRPPEIESPLNALAKVSQVKNAMNQNRLFDMKVAESERAAQFEGKRRNALMSAMNPETGQIDDAVYTKGLAGIGDYEGLQSFRKSQTEQMKAQNDAESGKFDLAKKRYDAYRKEAGALFNDPSVTAEKVAASIDRLAQAQMLPPELAKNIAAAIPSDQVALRDFLRQGVAAQLTPEQMLTAFAPEAEKIDNGQQITYRDMNPNSPTYGQTTGGAPVQKMQSPDSVASVGASMANAAATREVAKATRDAAGMQRDRDTEMKIADDYRAQSKPFKEVGDAYRTINATLDKANQSPAATLAAATKFMKLLDPGSVVRESELGMALAASGVIDRATNYFNVLQRGKVLTPDQVKDFKNITRQIYTAAQEGQKAIDANYTQQAKTYGLRPEMIVQDLGQNTTAGPPQIKTDDDFNALPSGTEFIDPNGKRRRKP